MSLHFAVPDQFGEEYDWLSLYHESASPALQTPIGEGLVGEASGALLCFCSEKVCTPTETTPRLHRVCGKKGQSLTQSAYCVQNTLYPRSHLTSTTIL